MTGGRAASRREMLQAAGALGAALAVGGRASASAAAPRERADLYADGVASGDPDEASVLLWTRRPFPGRTRAELTAEVALDPDFRRVTARVRAPVVAEADWTCRVLAAGLRPATTYWYRFTDDEGFGSRIGRTRTAPRPDADTPVRFAFVSCQSVNEGAQNAYRRMIWEDEHAPPERRLDFVLHLGDFIYEVVQYPDEQPGRYGRRTNDIGRVPDARKVRDFHVPITLEGYRAVYRAHVRDPDILDARARFPFVCIGDNHEFSWQGFQSFVKYDRGVEPAQALRVAANQAWWEYIPARVRKVSGPGLERFHPPAVETTPVTRLDDDGQPDEPNSRAAVGSLTAYRALRFGRHVELIVTDMHSWATEDPSSRPESATLSDRAFPNLFPQEAMEALDAGREHPGGAPETLRFGAAQVANFRRESPPGTILGPKQKAWFKRRLAASTATWKIWAASNGTLDWRTDPQNLPAGLTKPWPGAGYACWGGGDMGATYRERAELYDHVRRENVEGFVTVSGDRHSFWAGYAAVELPPRAFEPVGVAFITGSISAPGLAEALEYGFAKTHPLRPLFVADRPKGPRAAVDVLLKHGVRSALEWSRTGDMAAARRVRNADNAPHLEFVDMGGHGYAVVTAGPTAIETEFVCIPRPVSRALTPDGGPLRYRVVHRAERWRPGERPKLTRRVLEGDVETHV